MHDLVGPGHETGELHADFRERVGEVVKDSIQPPGSLREPLQADLKCP
jgi:hypothetical protein